MHLELRGRPVNHYFRHIISGSGLYISGKYHHVKIEEGELQTFQKGIDSIENNKQEFILAKKY